MLGALRTSARAARTAAQSVRHMSAGASVEEAAKEANKWRIITLGCIPMCIGLGVVTMSAAHEHHRAEVEYPYMRIRVKDFPWGPDGLFERKH